MSDDPNKTADASTNPGDTSSDQSILNDKDSLIRQLNEEITSLKQANDTLLSEKKTADEEIKTLKTQLSSKDQEILKLKKNLSDLIIEKKIDLFYKGTTLNGQKVGKTIQATDNKTIYHGQYDQGKFYGRCCFISNEYIVKGNFEDPYFDGRVVIKHIPSRVSMFGTITKGYNHLLDNIEINEYQMGKTRMEILVPVKNTHEDKLSYNGVVFAHFENFSAKLIIINNKVPFDNRNTMMPLISHGKQMSISSITEDGVITTNTDQKFKLGHFFKIEDLK